MAKGSLEAEMLADGGIANCVAWARMGNEDHDPSVTIICNGKDEGSKKVEVGTEHAGEVWTDVMGWRQGEVTIGEGEFLLPIYHDDLIEDHLRQDPLGVYARSSWPTVAETVRAFAAAAGTSG